LQPELDWLNLWGYLISALSKVELKSVPVPFLSPHPFPASEALFASVSSNTLYFWDEQEILTAQGLVSFKITRAAGIK
jgi:hypothetical protein